MEKQVSIVLVLYLVCVVVSAERLSVGDRITPSNFVGTFYDELVGALKLGGGEMAQYFGGFIVFLVIMAFIAFVIGCFRYLGWRLG